MENVKRKLRRIKGVKCYKIICERCGKPRYVRPQNVKSVRLCKSCQFDKRREYNTEYIKEYRRRKRPMKEVIKEKEVI